MKTAFPLAALTLAVHTLAGGAGAQQFLTRVTPPDAEEEREYGHAVSLDGTRMLVGRLDLDGGFPKSGGAFVHDHHPSFGNTTTELVPWDGSGDDSGFGAAVSVEGSRAMVGAPYRRGFEEEDGAVYVFREIDGDWKQVSLILSPDWIGAKQFDRFGRSVEIDGDHAVIGARGRAYVFARTLSLGGELWKLDGILDPPYGADPSFGVSVSLDGDVALVGADEALSPDGIVESGAAYVYSRTGDGGWAYEATLLPEDWEWWTWKSFGTSVSLDGGRAAVGAPNALWFYGAAYVYRRDFPGLWIQEQKIIDSDVPYILSSPGHGNAGHSVSLDGGRLVVGAARRNGAQPEEGAAFVFGLVGTKWNERAKLTDTSPHGWDRFGHAVSISGELVLVGAPLDNIAAHDAGSASLFGVE